MDTQKLTVFTPAYNRAHTLPRTYESLCRQSCKDFVWLIVDDGSSDGRVHWSRSGRRGITVFPSDISTRKTAGCTRHTTWRMTISQPS